MWLHPTACNPSKLTLYYNMLSPVPEPLRHCRIDHIAVAVKSLDAAEPIYRLLGGVIHAREQVAEQGVEVLPVEFNGVQIELLQPKRDESPVGKFIDRRGEGLHHIAIGVDDITQMLEVCRSNGIDLIDQRPRVGAGGKLIAFLHPRSTGGVLIELTQKLSPGTPPAI